MYSSALHSVLFVVLAALAVLLPASAGATTLTLDQCLDRALADNPEIKAYQIATQEADAGVGEAVGAFLPALTLSYDVSQLYDSSGQGADADYIDQQTDRFSVRVSQPLFAGFGNLAGWKKARENRQYREKELEFVTSQLLNKVRVKFYDVLRAGQAVEKRRDSVKRLEEQVLVADAWVRQSLAPRVHLLEAEVVLSNAKQELITAEAGLAVARAELEELLAYAGDTPLDVDGSLARSYPEPCTEVAVCIERGLNQRLEMTLSSLSIEMARQEGRMILARSLPRANLDASWTDYQRDYDDELRIDDERDYYSVMVNVSFQPFDGGRSLFAYRRQRLVLARLEKLKLKQQNMIVAEVKSRYEQLLEGQSRVQAATVTLTQAREAYQLRQRSVELGVSSLREYLDSSVLLIRAEINQIDSHHALQVARAQLDLALGN